MYKKSIHILPPTDILGLILGERGLRVKIVLTQLNKEWYIYNYIYTDHE